MNAEINQSSQGTGNWTAFLVGAIFNVMVSVDFNKLLEQGIIALLGGIFWVAARVISNLIINRMDAKAKGKSKSKKSKKEKTNE